MIGLATRLATCFGIGHIPLLPGTAASLVALPLGWVLVRFGWQAVVAGVLIGGAIGIWACGLYARKARMQDPPECVLDEVAGQWLALVPVAVFARGGDWRPFIMALIFFRLFDILKPWPVGTVQSLRGGLGIVMDDLLAGILAAILLYGVLAIQLV